MLVDSRAGPSNGTVGCMRLRPGRSKIRGIRRDVFSSRLRQVGEKVLKVCVLLGQNKHSKFCRISALTSFVRVSRPASGRRREAPDTIKGSNLLP